MQGHDGEPAVSVRQLTTPGAMAASDFVVPCCFGYVPILNYLELE